MRFFTIMSLVFQTNVVHMNFWMCILDLTSILLKLLYHVSRTLTPLEEENVGNMYPIFLETPYMHLYLLSDLHTKGVQEWPSFEMVSRWPFNHYFICQFLWSHHSLVAMISPVEKLSLYNYNNFFVSQFKSISSKSTSTSFSSS